MRKPTKTQFRYASNASAFIELDYSMTRECFVAQLRGVSDVELVGDCNRKFDPGNPGMRVARGQGTTIRRVTTYRLFLSGQKKLKESWNSHSRAVDM